MMRAMGVAKQLRYADRKGCQIVVICGEELGSRKEVTVKEIRRQEENQRPVPVDALGDYLCWMLSRSEAEQEAA